LVQLHQVLLLLDYGRLLLQELLFDLLQLRSDGAEVLDDGKDLSTSVVELVFQLLDGICCLLLRLDLGGLMELARRLFTCFDSGKGRLVDLLNSSPLKLLLLGRVNFKDLLRAESIDLGLVLMSLLLLGGNLLTELLFVLSHFLAVGSFLQHDEVTLLAGLLLDEGLALHEQLLHLTLLLLLNLKLLLQLLLLLLLLDELLCFLLSFFLLGFLHFLHLILGLLLSFLLSLLSDLGLLDSSLEFSFLFGFFSKSLLSLLFKL